MTRAAALLLALGVTSCAAWPTGSYVDLRGDADAPPLAAVAVDQVARVTEAGQTVRLAPPQDAANALTPAVTTGLQARGVQVVDTSASHSVQYVAAPLDGGELLRLTIDGVRGGAQFFTRDVAGILVPGGPFTGLTQ